MGLEQTVADGQLLVASLIALAAGLVSFLSPCVLPLLPGYLAYVSGIAGADERSTSVAGGSAVAGSAKNSGRPPVNGVTAAADPRVASRTQRRRMVIGSLLFVLGFTIIFLVLNILVGSVGLWLWEWQDVIIRVMGALVILLGLVFIGAFSKLQSTSRLKFKPRIGLVGAPVLGMVFAIGWAPCMGPTLGVVMSLSLQAGSLGRAALLAIAYCLGLGLPFVLAAFGFGWMTQTITFFKRHIRAVNLIGGALLILIGLLMVTGLWSQMMFAMQAVIGNFGTIL